MYDYLIVGAGVFGATFSRLLSENNKKVLIIDKRPDIGGAAHTEKQGEIYVHKHGAHIFHTNNDSIWQFVNRFSDFTDYRHKVKVNYKNTIYSFPVNMMTFHQLWGCQFPYEAQEMLARQREKIINPSNLEEMALSLYGREIYEKFIYGYTLKQWGVSPTLLPKEIIKRLPIRFTFNDNYFDSKYQGIPINGYTSLIENMIGDTDIKLNTEFDKKNWRKLARNLVYSGSLDEFCDYKYGKLGYRSLRFEHKRMTGDFQGCAVMNYTDENVPYTRIIEHKHFLNPQHSETVITYEYSSNTGEPYYPINDIENNEKYEMYRKEVPPDVVVGGRLGLYKYYDMDQIIGSAMKLAVKSLL